MSIVMPLFTNLSRYCFESSEILALIAYYLLTILETSVFANVYNGKRYISIRITFKS